MYYLYYSHIKFVVTHKLTAHCFGFMLLKDIHAEIIFLGIVFLAILGKLRDLNNIRQLLYLGTEYFCLLGGTIPNIYDSKCA